MPGSPIRGRLAIAPANAADAAKESDRKKAQQPSLITRQSLDALGGVELARGEVVGHARILRASSSMGRSARASAIERASRSMGWVSRPVNVFCWLGWYEPTTS